jgi:hypothetical protein
MGNEAWQEMSSENRIQDAAVWPDSLVLTADKAAGTLKISVSSLHTLAREGKLPRGWVVQISARKRRFHARLIQEWLDDPDREPIFDIGGKQNNDAHQLRQDLAFPDEDRREDLPSLNRQKRPATCRNGGPKDHGRSSVAEKAAKRLAEIVASHAP